MIAAPSIDEYERHVYHLQRKETLEKWLSESDETRTVFGYMWRGPYPPDTAFGARTSHTYIRRSVQIRPEHDRGRPWVVHVAVDERTGEALAHVLKEIKRQAGIATKPE